VGRITPPKLLSADQSRKPGSGITGRNLQVRSFRLSGLKPVEGQEIFKAKGLSGSEDKSAVLIEQYAGNPLALKIVATAIQDVFDGNVAEFLTKIRQFLAIFAHIISAI